MSNKIEITKFKAFQKNTLQGFFSLKIISWTLEFHGCCLHQKGDSRWVSMPAKSYEVEGGGQRWSPVLEFHDKDIQARFQKSVLEAIDAYMATG